MSILGINTSKNEKQNRKTIWAYMIFSVLAVAVDKVYGLYSHGVDSASMTWMFLYPLIGGALFLSLIERLFPHITNVAGYRVFINGHNSGITTLTLANLLKGVFEIAGTNSPHLVFYYVVGWAFIAVGLIIMFIMVANQKRRVAYEDSNSSL